MNAPMPVSVSIPSLAMSEPELIAVLSNSIYPGGKPESIKLAIAYCRGAHLDPLQKPVHIVPMDAKTGRKDQSGKDIYEKRDVIMPGIGLYRVQAARTGEYAGMSDPEFGPTKTLTYKDRDDGIEQQQEYPEWCRVVVRRIVEGRVVEFSAIEYWLENYATAGNWTKAPNKMWKKRPRGQIAKCAEAQALRKAFPEVGAQPTAEEMEGKVIEAEEITPAAPMVEGPKAAAAEPEAGAEPQSKPFKPMNESQVRMLRAKLKSNNLDEAAMNKHFGKVLGASDETGFHFDDFMTVQKWVASGGKE